MNDILKHILELSDQRGWSLNYLAAKADVPQSTLSGLYQRNNCPTVPTLEKICDAFGITMSEFFAGEGDLTVLTEDHQKLLGKWRSELSTFLKAFPLRDKKSHKNNVYN